MSFQTLLLITGLLVTGAGVGTYALYVILDILDRRSVRYLVTGNEKDAA